MNNIIQYKGYTGTVEFSQADALFYGRVTGIRSLISYEGTTAKELIEDFHEAVDEYLTLCAAQNVQPERAYNGTFNVRVDPELHRQSALYASAHCMTLNGVVEAALRRFVAEGQ